MAKTKEQKLIENKEQQNQIRKLEQFYVEGKVDDMLQAIQKEKEKLVDEMVEYAKKHEKPCKWSKDGDELDYVVEINPIVINNAFFKPICPITSQEPIYNAEKLGMVFDYYCEILAEVNDKIGNYPSSLTSFCKMAGITTMTLRNYRYSDDYNMRVIAEKIYDQIGDENVTMSQMGVVKEKTTLFKMKAQNEMVEKAQPQIKVNVTADAVDMDRIKDRIAKYSNYVTKKGK